MNHFAFVIKGVSSTEPFPAGSYKTDPTTQTGDVDVSIAPTEQEITTKPQLDLNLSSIITSGLPFGGSVTIHNLGNSTIFSPKLSFDSANLGLATQTLDPIPPLSTDTVNLSGRTSSLNLNSEETTTANLSGTDTAGQPVKTEAQQHISIKPIYVIIIPLLALLSAIFLAIFLPFHFRFQIAAFVKKIRLKTLKS
jgi:hypothetical protein